MTETINVAIIGAGPYGLSVAAHLRGAGVPFEIYGSRSKAGANTCRKR